MSQQSVVTGTPVSLTWRIDLLLTLETLEARRPGTIGVITLVDLGVGITQLDGDVALQLVLEPHSLHLGNRLDDRRLPVGDMTNGTDVDRSLPGNNLGRQRGQRRQIERLWIRLLGQLWPFRLGGKNPGLLHGRLAGLLLLRLLGFLLLVEGPLLLHVQLTVCVQHGRSGLGVIV